MASYQAGAKALHATLANGVEPVPTRPPSFANCRLIAANWLSNSILTYALLLTGLAVILGLATVALMTNLGRRGGRHLRR